MSFITYGCLLVTRIGQTYSEDKVSQLLRDMLSSLNYLHSMGIVHRDIKLENFIIEDDSCRLILIDFGLSKTIDRNEKLSQVVGSSYYTAPEVINRCYDTKCDVWSIGVMLYMLLAGMH